MRKRSQHGGPESHCLVEPLWSDTWRLEWVSRGADAVSSRERRGWITAALTTATAQGAREVQTRVVLEGDWGAIVEVLVGLGFEQRGDRVEFRSLVTALPPDEGSPFAWRAMSPAGPVVETTAAALMGEASQGDPDADPAEDPLAALRGLLEDPALTSDPGCVQVGFIDGVAAAVVIAQVNPQTGRSRIAYMALLPRFRGQRLGQWVHRHGFAMLRAQGGVLYQGGTHAANLPMLRLFAAAGCEEHRRMQDWIYRAPVAPVRGA